MNNKIIKLKADRSKIIMHKSILSKFKILKEIIDIKQKETSRK